MRTVFVLNKPTKISGQGHDKTTLSFSLKIAGERSDGTVEIEDLKIKGGLGNGLNAEGGMHVIMRGCTVEECEYCGVEANEADISCDDLQVVGCGWSGVCASGTATIMLSGQGTRIQGNGTKERTSDYGLDAYHSSSNIQLVAPLTKETISIYNSGFRDDGFSRFSYRNCGGIGTIEQVSGGSADETKSDSTTPAVSLIVLCFSCHFLI